MKCQVLFRVVMLTTAMIGGQAFGQDALEFSDVEQVSFGGDSSVFVDKGCDDCGKGCDDYCGPRWSVGFGGVYLHRSNEDNVPLAVARTQQAAGTPVLLNTNDADLGWEAGFAVDLTYHRPCGCDFQFAYLGMSEWSSRFGVVDATPGPPTPNSDFAAALPLAQAIGINALNSPYDAVLGQYDSRLHSFEANTLWSGACHGLTLLAGFRYVSLDEDLLLDFQTFATDVAFDAQFKTQNDLFGMQVGALHRYSHGCCSPLSIDSWFKSGVYYNSTSQHTLVTPFPGGDIPPLDVSSNEDQASFLTEAGIRANYCLGGSWSIYGGYQVMWIGNAALATGQVSNGTNAGSADNFVGVNTGGSAFYHGANFGIVYTR